MLHEIKRLSGRPNEAAVFTGTALRGLALQFKAGDPETFLVADGTVPDAGCLTRDVTADGPTLGDSIYPGRSDSSLPFKSGTQVSVEHAHRMEVEGSDFIDGSVSAATANDTPLTFTGGKISTVASGQIPLFRLISKPTPEVAGNVRILVERTSLRAP